MNEHFLSFIWKYSYYNTNSLFTTEGFPLNIIKPGILNTNSGPDFDNADIQIGPLSWKGNVELHVKSSDWNKHKHQYDKAYNTVVLHVVWEDDAQVMREDGTAIPTFELKSFVDHGLMDTYSELFSENQFIPCEENFSTIKRVTKLSFLDKLLTSRLERKAEIILDSLEINGGDWRETTFQVIAGVFGIKVNQKSFEKLARQLSYKIVQKHKGNLIQIESLLFGQAGFLAGDREGEYQNVLHQEYTFLAKKYSLRPALKREEWKFSRMRPSSFPALRIATLAAMLNEHSDIFLKCLDVVEPTEIKQWLGAKTSGYWLEHYDFSKKSQKIKPGDILVQNMIINGVVPLKVAYGMHKNQHRYLDEAISLLEKLKPEKNKITTQWKDQGLPLMNACDSQASLELYHEYCIKKKCLNCAVGVELIRLSTN